MCAVKTLDPVAHVLFSLPFSSYKVFRDICLSSLQFWNITQKSIPGIISVPCPK